MYHGTGRRFDGGGFTAATKTRNCDHITKTLHEHGDRDEPANRSVGRHAPTDLKAKILHKGTPRTRHEQPTARSCGRWCRGEDSNLHILTDTRPSSVRVYQFRHHGKWCDEVRRFYQSSRKGQSMPLDHPRPQPRRGDEKQNRHGPADETDCDLLHEQFPQYGPQQRRRNGSE